MRGFRARGGAVERQEASAELESWPAIIAESGAAANGAQDSVTVVINRSAGIGGTASGAYVAPAPGGTYNHTEVLDAQVAASLVDPGASTQVLSRGPVMGPGHSAEAGEAFTGSEEPAGAPPPPAPLVSRRVAAEIGVYTGAALILVSIGGVVGRGWSAWEPDVRWAFAALTTVALTAAGLFVRLPWSRTLTDERRRAVSALLTTGVAVATTGVGVALGATQGAIAAGGASAARALGVVLAMVLVNLVARTPVSESGLLGALAWSAWIAVPPGPGTWALLVGLGVAWGAVGMRVARGRRTAMVVGAALALVASVGMAAGPWAWPTRAALAAVAVLGLGAFLRGRANHWLALGAAAATALAASVAGDVVGPALALLVGGLATMAVSWIALRSARRA
ncbi:MAG TPA: hypothetical protein VES03_01700 [Motilibacterales bacterium]|nr:hypothetical protein [Motilibacterales bacterium]